jgi:hypothetical protein
VSSWRFLAWTRLGAWQKAPVHPLSNGPAY